MDDPPLGLDAPEFEALAQDALRTDNFVSLLSFVGALSDVHDHLRRRTHKRLNSLLAVAHRIGQRVNDDDASFNTFAANDFWRTRKPNRARSMLAAVQFVFRPKSTSERKLASKYSHALREFDKLGVTPENLPEAIQQTKGGLSAAARQWSAGRRPSARQLSAGEATSVPVPPVPDAPGRADNVPRVDAELDRAPDAAHHANWKLTVRRGLAAQLSAWHKAGTATQFRGTFRLADHHIGLIAAHPITRSPIDSRVVNVHLNPNLRQPFGGQRSAKTPDSQ